MTPDELIARYPRLFHVAHVDAWEGIQRHGLLSTTALLDLFDVSGAQREAIERRHRPGPQPLTHARHGVAVIRDQKPLNEAKLAAALRDGLTPREWYETLNRQVFFWLTEERCAALLGARAYRDHRHLVLELRTADLLATHGAAVRLSAINSGSTAYAPAPRGNATFLSVTDFRFDAQRRRRGARGIAELTVAYAVPDVVSLVESVKIRGGGQRDVVLWRR